MVALQIITAGFVGTTCMTAVMTFIHRAGWANGDMIRALGSLVTKSYHNAIAPGLAIHLTSGCLFAIPYTFILRALPVQSTFAYLVVGTALGVFHGVAMSFVLLATVSEKHPLDQFRNAGFDVAAAHVAGHVAYGLAVGAVAAAFAL